LLILYKNDPKAYTEDFGDPFDLTPKSRDEFAFGRKAVKKQTDLRVRMKLLQPSVGES
jgi:hypothetical protein